MMNKETRKQVKEILEDIVFGEFLLTKSAEYFDCKVVNITKNGGQYIFDVIRYYENGSERSDDCYWDVEDITQKIDKKFGRTK